MYGLLVIAVAIAVVWLPLAIVVLLPLELVVTAVV